MRPFQYTWPRPEHYRRWGMLLPLRWHSSLQVGAAPVVRSPLTECEEQHAGAYQRPEQPQASRANQGFRSALQHVSRSKFVSWEYVLGRERSVRESIGLLSWNSFGVLNWSPKVVQRLSRCWLCESSVHITWYDSIIVGKVAHYSVYGRSKHLSWWKESFVSGPAPRGAAFQLKLTDIDVCWQFFEGMLCLTKVILTQSSKFRRNALTRVCVITATASLTWSRWFSCFWPGECRSWDAYIRLPIVPLGQLLRGYPLEVVGSIWRCMTFSAVVVLVHATRFQGIDGCKGNVDGAAQDREGEEKGKCGWQGPKAKGG